MTNKNINKIYFRGNEIVALYRGDTLIFKKSGVVPPSPSGKYTVRGTVNPYSGEQSIQLCVNGKQEQFNVNSDNTFEHTFVNVPITNMDYFTQPCRDKLKTLDLSSFDTSQVTSMIQAFIQCNKLEEIILTNLDTSSVTDMTMMFYGCSALTSLDVSNFNTSNVTNMYQMFKYCQNLGSLDLSNFDTSKVTNMSEMFYSNMYMRSLDVSNFDASNVTDMSNMFDSCEMLTTLDLSSFNTSKVTNMSKMFQYCRYLVTLNLPNLDTSNVTNMDYIFRECTKLTDLYINFNLKSITEVISGPFYYCLNLKNVVGKFEGTKINLWLSDCPLTSASAMVFINGLATVTEKRTLELSATTYDSLTNEQIAIATAKGWTVARY